MSMGLKIIRVKNIIVSSDNEEIFKPYIRYDQLECSEKFRTY